MSAVGHDIQFLAEGLHPLVQEAVEMVRPHLQIEDGAAPELIAQAHATQAFVLLVQALLQTFPFNEFGATVAMGAATGTVLANCAGDRRMLYRAFKAQTGATLQELEATAALLRAAPEGAA